MSDSPMWKRGKRSRSYSLTLQPCWASRVETVLPAGPPPMTMTSAVLLVDMSVIISFITVGLCCQKFRLPDIRLQLRPAHETQDERSRRNGCHQGHEDEHAEDAIRHNVQVLAQVDDNEGHQPSRVHERPNARCFAQRVPAKPGRQAAA